MHQGRVVLLRQHVEGPSKNAARGCRHKIGISPWPGATLCQIGTLWIQDCRNANCMFCNDKWLNSTMTFHIHGSRQRCSGAVHYTCAFTVYTSSLFGSIGMA